MIAPNPKTVHYTVPKSWHDEYAAAQAERMKDPFYRWISSPECAAVTRKIEDQRLQDHKQAEKDGICSECENPRLPKHVICSGCAEGLSEEDLAEFLLPSLRAFEKAETEKNNREIQDTYDSLMPGRV
jgi:hypothetical protein